MSAVVQEVPSPRYGHKTGCFTQKLVGDKTCAGPWGWMDGMCCHRSRGGGVRLAVPVNRFVAYSGLLEGCPRLDPTRPG